MNSTPALRMVQLTDMQISEAENNAHHAIATLEGCSHRNSVYFKAGEILACKKCVNEAYRAMRECRAMLAPVYAEATAPKVTP